MNTLTVCLIPKLVTAQLEGTWPRVKGHTDLPHRDRATSIRTGQRMLGLPVNNIGNLTNIFLRNLLQR